MKKLPLVSIVTPTYNHEKFVVQSLESIRNQTYKNIQHIIIDDFSQDNTAKITEEWIAKNNYDCIFIKHSKNVGICKTLNESLKLSNGKYWSGCSSDDMFNIQKLEISVNILENTKDKNLAFTHGNFNIIDEHGKYNKKNVNCKKSALTDDDFINFLTTGYDIQTLTALFRFDALKDVGFFNEDLGFEDLDLTLRLLLKGYTHKRILKPLADYRKIRGGNSISDNHRKNYLITKDFIKMNKNHYSTNKLRNKVNRAVLKDAESIYKIEFENKKWAPPLNKIQTIWTPFMLTILREKKLLLNYIIFALSLSLQKKYSPYNFRDSVFLIKSYFNKNHKFL